MFMVRPYKCPFCGASRSTGKGMRKTKTMGPRVVRRCRQCGRKFTPRHQKLLAYAPGPAESSPAMRSVFPTSSEPCSALPRLGAEVLAVVGRYRDGARAFYYEVMLSGQSCPRCGGGLVMAAEGRCRCTGCGAEFDPTVEFQRCSSCDGVPRIRARHYECSRCRAVIASRFLFDGLVFDAAYFRQKMAEHRQRQRESRDRVRAMLAENRSPPLAPMTADAVGTAGLWEALNHLAMVPPPGVAETRERFDLQRYQTHVRAHVGTIAVMAEYGTIERKHLLDKASGVGRADGAGPASSTGEVPS